MEKIYNTGDCNKISISFELSNNFGFIPLFTRVYLDLQNSTPKNNPVLTTPAHLVDASIPLTEPFVHYKGLLYYETYISYAALSDISDDDLEKKLDKLIFSYKIFDCEKVEKQFEGYDLGPYYVKSKQLIYFVTLIDLT